jgi:hypothetical protein
MQLYFIAGETPTGQRRLIASLESNEFRSKAQAESVLHRVPRLGPERIIKLKCANCN